MDCFFHKKQLNIIFTLLERGDSLLSPNKTGWTSKAAPLGGFFVLLVMIYGSFPSSLSFIQQGSSCLGLFHIIRASVGSFSFAMACTHSLRKALGPFLTNRNTSRSHFSLREGEAKLKVGQIHFPTAGPNHSGLI